MLPSGKASIHSQTKHLLWIGFGGLLLLMVVLGLRATSFLRQIEQQQNRIRQDYIAREEILDHLRSDIYLSGTYLRDVLLDTSEAEAALHKQRFLETRQRIDHEVEAYRRSLRPEEQRAFAQLTTELSGYLAVAAPVLNWTPEQRRANGHAFMDAELLPRRMLAVGFADQIREISQRHLQVSSLEVSRLFASFRSRLLLLLFLTAVIGILLASFTLWRVLHLEKESESRFTEVLETREQLKRLSAELVSAQEVERHRISRELHDEVGQVLSASVLGLENLRSSLLHQQDGQALEHLQLVQEMTQRNVNVVRNMSLLLRPTMLDDLGLLPALKWLAREVSRTTAVQVDVSGELPDDLPEEHRTCVYRVVQEAVRNATRHAHASQVRIYVKWEPPSIRVSVQDDGGGFDPALEAGLGLLGMKERVLHLGGEFQVKSERGSGTMVSFELPVLTRS